MPENDDSLRRKFDEKLLELTSKFPALELSVQHLQASQEETKELIKETFGSFLETDYGPLKKKVEHHEDFRKKIVWTVGLVGFASAGGANVCWRLLTWLVGN